MNKSLEDLQLDLIEVQAYRINQDYKDKEYYTVWWIYDVDRNEKDDPTSEDEYFSIIEQSLRESIEYYNINNPPVKKKRKPRLNQYERKLYGNYKIKKARERWDYNRKWWKFIIVVRLLNSINTMQIKRLELLIKNLN